MKKTNVFIVIALFTSLLSLKATNISIPNGNFNNLSGTLYAPIALGTSTGTEGAWNETMTGVLSLFGYMEVGTAASMNAPVPPDGTYVLDISLPANLIVSNNLSQTLTNQLIPNSTYTLSVDIDQGTVLNLLANSTLSLNIGNTNLAVMTGAGLASILNTSTNYHTVTLTYKTGNTVPTNGINITFNAAQVAGVAGNIYLSDFQLSVNPIQVNSVLSEPGAGGNLSLSGSGGAPNATYEIVTSTNLFASTNNWSSVMTNQFDSSGDFNASFKVDPTIPERFFRVVLP